METTSILRSLWIARTYRAKEAQSYRSFLNHTARHPASMDRLKDYATWCSIWKKIERKCMDYLNTIKDANNV